MSPAPILSFSLVLTGVVLLKGRFCSSTLKMFSHIVPVGLGLLAYTCCALVETHVILPVSSYIPRNSFQCVVEGCSGAAHWIVRQILRFVPSKYRGRNEFDNLIVIAQQQFPSNVSNCDYRN